MPLTISIKRITISLFAFALACALMASGCSKGGGAGLHIKSAATGEKDLAIVSRKGGADSRFFLDRSTLNGQVKVTTATADEIAGDIDITGGDNVIKGSFTAKVLKRK